MKTPATSRRVGPRDANLIVIAAATALAGAPWASADVTIQQQTTFDLAIVKAHGASTESTTVDKQRRDSELHCEGFFSLMCGNNQSGEIVRLDKDLSWSLDPQHKTYKEAPFPTAEQRQEAERKVKELMQKMQQCPAMQQHAAAQGPDTSKCQMSPPVIDVKATDQHATIAGHDARLTQVALTQSCRNMQTGDECKYSLALDSWLTQDQIPGVEESKAFRTAYLKKLGLDQSSELVQQQMKQFLAPYQDSLKQLAAKGSDLKGYPLKSTVRILFGGEQCAAAKQQQSAAGGGSAVGSASEAAGDAATSAGASTAGAAAGQAASNATGNSAMGSILGPAASAFGSTLARGLFKKKSGPAPAAAPADNGAPAGMVQAASFTVETTSIAVAPVPATQFDIPPGWKLVVPKPHEEKEFTCPQGGG
ncbi:MAG TPA: hypothetical protein VKQ31_00065 [Steroidobacteraceae bacterium]|nr:hypothetical protein [Steroidobacteraceae bacterium]